MAGPRKSPVFNENGDRQVGGFPPEILTTFDPKFLCCHCHKILRDPVQGICGHRFCRSCRDEMLSAAPPSTPLECPACIEEKVDPLEVGKIISEQMFPDNAVRRELTNKPVSCVFPGCSWNGKFREYEAHELECEFRLVTCPVCAEAVASGSMEKHRNNQCVQRQVNCEFCQTQLIFVNLQAHLDECEMRPVKCDHCIHEIIRENMKEHLDKQCPKRQIICPAGCPDPFTQDQMSMHLNKAPAMHIAWLMHRVVALEQKMDLVTGGFMPTSLHQLKGEMAVIDKKIQTIERVVLTQTQQVQVAAMTSTTSEPPQGSSADGARGDQNTEVKGPKPCPEVPAKSSLRLVEPIIAVLHNELDKATHALGILDGHFRQQQAQLDELESRCRIQHQSLSLKDAAIADLEMRLAAQEMARYDGTILWKVSGFEAKKKEAVSGQTTSLYSPAFYSGPCGYKMCARIYPNGDGIGKSSHISLFFVIMRGHYDALLPWPFSQKVTLMMIDQNHKEHIVDAFKPDPTSTSFKRPSTEMNIASGCPLFLPLDKLHSRQHGYLRDDTIFVKIIVDTDGLDRFTEMNPGRFATGYP